MTSELQQFIKKIKKSADLVYQSKDYTSATILYFKTFFVILDLIIFSKNKTTPKDHTERFRILEKDFPEYYTILDKYFSIYRDTYSLTIEKEKCDIIKYHVEQLITKQKLSE